MKDPHILKKKKKKAGLSKAALICFRKPADDAFSGYFPLNIHVNITSLFTEQLCMNSDALYQVCMPSKKNYFIILFLIVFY